MPKVSLYFDTSDALTDGGGYFYPSAVEDLLRQAASKVIDLLNGGDRSPNLVDANGNTVGRVTIDNND
jgi:hypothetical protein